MNKSGRRAPDEVSKTLSIDLFDVQTRKTGKMKDKYYLGEKVTLKKPWGWKIAEERKQTYLHQPKYSTLRNLFIKMESNIILNN